ncbi:MAG: DUF4191 domain-containing protein [Kineosporiaceae bacterium]|jgi:hypothetical protein
MAAKKSDTDAAPTKQGRLRQYWTVFDVTRRHDPAVVWWMLLALFGTIGVSVGLGFVLGHPVYLSIFGVMIGATIALYVLTRRAEAAAFAQLAGQPGASVAALQNLRKGWTVVEEPSAVDPRTQDLVFRVIGRPGVVLITEGPLPRVNKLAENERKRIGRVLGQNVPVHIISAGDAPGQITLRKLTPTLVKMKPALSKTEVTEVIKRLRALGGIKPPIPKGVDPFRARPDRRANRGR